MSEKIYRVQMNSKGMPNFATAVEIDTDISEYSDRLWRNAYERGKADRPQGEWKSVKASIYPYGYDVECSVCGHRMGSSFGYKYCPMCGAHMKGADDD